LRQLALDASRGGASLQKLEKRAPDELLPKPDHYELRTPRGCSLLFPKAIANGEQTNFAVTKSNTGIKLQRRLIVKHGSNWCEIHSSDLCFFRWSEKYSDSAEFLSRKKTGNRSRSGLQISRFHMQQLVLKIEVSRSNDIPGNG